MSLEAGYVIVQCLLRSPLQHYLLMYKVGNSDRGEMFDSKSAESIQVPHSSVNYDVDLDLRCS
jgi:hypothetical protein